MSAISRQRKWQLKMKEEGRCQQCGQPENHYSIHCDSCRKKKRIFQRKWRGYKPWKPGKPGRPPIIP